MAWYCEYKPYVPVAQRRAEAAREVAKRRKAGETITPVVIEGRNVTSTFWGKSWCENLERYSDFENRLPRGRTYVRNGSVVHLKIEKGRVTALVSGSSIYKIQIDIAPLPKSRWEALKKRCAGQIGSLVELLQGKLSKGVMELVTDRASGLFPSPKEIKLSCSCPDYAGLCKHLAAVMYGVGHRLDSSPELLFLLRGVDHTELIAQALPAAPQKARRGAPTIAADALGDIFGIEIDSGPARRKTTPARKRPATTAKPASQVAKAEVPAKKKSAARKAPAAKIPAQKAAPAKSKAPVAAKKKSDATPVARARIKPAARKG